MLEALLGSNDAERALVYIAARGSGYGREIADFWNTNLSGIQRQLDKLEAGGILRANQIGRTRVYTWNERWPFRRELSALIDKAITFLPEAQQHQLAHYRQRPRRRNNPL